MFKKCIITTACISSFKLFELSLFSLFSLFHLSVSFYFFFSLFSLSVCSCVRMRIFVAISVCLYLAMLQRCFIDRVPSITFSYLPASFQLVQYLAFFLLLYLLPISLLSIFSPYFSIPPFLSHSSSL